jgi:MFS transporter, DHA1 family, multidrug resistance protein
MSTDSRLSPNEFVALMAFMTSLIALSIDGMLPAFPMIASELNVTTDSQLQYIVATLFLGFGFGQVLFGPLSDIFGRKPPIYWGIAIFLIGSLLSGFAKDYDTFLLGRFLQGFGGAAPRIISLALIRDQYVGNSMARITSLVMTVFILVPAIAPSLGQLVMWLFGWREIFILLFVVGLTVGIWFNFRQNETLAVENRKRLNFKDIFSGISQTFSHKTTVACMLTSGLIFGIFVGYLGAVQSIFDKTFHAGDYFPLYFAILALSIGGASFFNSKLVMAFGMRHLILYAFSMMIIFSIIFSTYLFFFVEQHPPLILFMIYMVFTFFCVGFLFGNLNALAMQPLGHIAGIGSAVLGFVQSTISVVIGVRLGQYYHNGIQPLVLSFGLVGFICLLIFYSEGLIKIKSPANSL